MIRRACTTLLLAIGLACAASAPRVARASGSECYSGSDCGGGKCSSGKCTTAGGKCYSDSECVGGKCTSGRCTNGR